MWYIYTHINIWVIYVYVCLRGLRLSERSSQNTEPHYDRISFNNFSEAHQPQKVCPYNRGVTKMIFLFYTFKFLILFCFQTREAKRVGDQDVNSLLVSAFSSFFLSSISSALLVSLWSLLWKWGGAEAQHTFVCPQPPCPVLPLPPLPVLSRMKAGMTVYIELTGSSTAVERCSVIGISFNRFLVALEGSAAPIVLLSSSQKILIVQEFGVLACLPKSVEAEVEVHLNHLFACFEKMDRKSYNHQPFHSQVVYRCWSYN